MDAGTPRTSRFFDFRKSKPLNEVMKLDRKIWTELPEIAFFEIVVENGPTDSLKPSTRGLRPRPVVERCSAADKMLDGGRG